MKFFFAKPTIVRHNAGDEKKFRPDEVSCAKPMIVANNAGDEKKFYPEEVSFAKPMVKVNSAGDEKKLHPKKACLAKPMIEWIPLKYSLEMSQSQNCYGPELIPLCNHFPESGQVTIAITLLSMPPARIEP